MTTPDIQAHLEEMCGVEILPTRFSPVAKAIQKEIVLWQNRSLGEVLPIASSCHDNSNNQA